MHIKYAHEHFLVGLSHKLCTHPSAHRIFFLQKLDPGAAVALGAPLHVRMFVPLWIVNATSLPVAAWVVPVQPPRQPSEREGPAAENLMDAAESIRLKVLDTEAVDAPLSPGTRSRRYHLPLCCYTGKGLPRQMYKYFWRFSLQISVISSSWV